VRGCFEIWYLDREWGEGREIALRKEEESREEREREREEEKRVNTRRHRVKTKKKREKEKSKVSRRGSRYPTQKEKKNKVGDSVISCFICSS
jgi:hypothetical protein